MTPAGAGAGGGRGFGGGQASGGAPGGSGFGGRGGGRGARGGAAQIQNLIDQQPDCEASRISSPASRSSCPDRQLPGFVELLGDDGACRRRPDSARGALDRRRSSRQRLEQRRRWWRRRIALITAAMCGIAGFTIRADIPDESLIRRMTATIVHRGPDQQGVYCSAGIALGAVRLQVIDLDGGEQPVRSGSKPTVTRPSSSTTARSTISVNCDANSNRWAIGSIPIAIPKWRCAPLSNGIRAVSKGCAACSRWRSGRSATGGWFWRATGWGSSRCMSGTIGNDLVFGSELKVLFEHPRCNAASGSRGAERLPFAALRAKPANAGGRHRETSFRPLSGMARRSFEGDSVLAAAVRARCLDRPKMTRGRNSTGLLRESVREELVSDVPLGVWSSGGIDSSTLLHYAAELGRASDQDVFDGLRIEIVRRRSPYFREIATLYGTEHHEFELNRDSGNRVRRLEDFALLFRRAGRRCRALCRSGSFRR